MPDPDFYAVLGVSKDATQKDITKAYRRLAKANHPDANPGDKAAEERFKQISAAYDTLSDDKKRKEYDDAKTAFSRFSTSRPSTHTRTTTSGARSPFDTQMPNLDDLLSSFLHTTARPGATRVGSNLATDITLSFKDSVLGVTTKVNDISVRVPAGVVDNQTIKLKGRGEPGPSPALNGDLLVTVHVTPHPHFTRSGKDISITVPVTYSELALGTTITIPTLTDSVNIKVAPGTKPGQTLRVPGRGVANPKAPGSLLVHLDLQVFKPTTDTERELLTKLGGFHPGAPLRTDLA